MPKLFALYCAVLIILLALADYYGVVYTSYLWGEEARATKSASNYHK